MFVVKRDGRREPVHFDKITARIMKLSYGLNPDFCDPVRAGAPSLAEAPHLKLRAALGGPGAAVCIEEA